MARAPLDLAVYLVTDGMLCGDVGVAATVAAAAAGGVTAVQLRAHELTDAETVVLGRELVRALAGTRIPLLIDDRVQLVAEIGADGAHVGQSDLPVREARALLGDDGLLGLSVGSLSELARALDEPAGAIDYLGVGPVWAQSTKADAAAPIGLASLGDVIAVSPWPIVAIGGIDVTRAGAVRAAGAHGVAVVSAICGQTDVTAATIALAEAWNGGVR
jgi:thiamine-phosphate pyrophosphorylase